jgi:Protein of unknown function (DUF1360)
MTDWLVWVLLSATTYTLGRLIALDSILDEPREMFLRWIGDDKLQSDPGWAELPLWRRKLYVLPLCPHCVTGWTSAGTVAVVDLGFEGLPLPVLWWFGAWAGALTFWAIIDNE